MLPGSCQSSGRFYPSYMHLNNTYINPSSNKLQDERHIDLFLRQKCVKRRYIVIKGDQFDRIAPRKAGGDALITYNLLKRSKRDTLRNLWRIIIMSDKNCTSCNAPLAEEGATEFGCPACGVKIDRCYRCREQSITYVCPKCGFGGP